MSKTSSSLVSPCSSGKAWHLSRAARRHVSTPVPPRLNPQAPACSTSGRSAYQEAAWTIGRRLQRAGPCMAVLGDEPQPQLERADGGVADDEYMKEYQQYKEGLLKGSRNAATAIALYLLVTAGGKAALCALYGSLGTNLYLLWMFYDVDNVKGTDVVPYRKAQQLENVSFALKWLAKLVAAYMHALRPRLLVPVGITAAAWAFSQSNPDEALTTLDYGCILLGFLSYKGALVTQIVQELSPKGYGEASSRPRVEQIEDELDMLGRPKKRSPLPTAALPDSVDTSKIPTPIIHSDDD